MLTLADIDAMFPETHDGSVYSDLHKEAYGYRPRGVTFESVEHFEACWKSVCAAQQEELESMKANQQKNLGDFLVRYENDKNFQQKVSEMLEDYLDISMVEFEYDLPYGSLKEILK